MDKVRYRQNKQEWCIKSVFVGHIFEAWDLGKEIIMSKSMKVGGMEVG